MLRSAGMAQDRTKNGRIYLTLLTVDWLTGDSQSRAFKNRHFLIRHQGSMDDEGAEAEADGGTKATGAIDESRELVVVNPEAVRPVAKVQAGEQHSRALASCLSPRSPSCASPASSDRSTRRQLAPPLDAFVLSELLSVEECAALRRCAEAADYSFWNAATSVATYRNSDTVEITSDQVAGEIWARVKHSVVPRVTIGAGAGAKTQLWEPGLEGEWEAYGINAHLLFNRYAPGGHFSPHTDGATVVDMNRRSLYSMLVYLNRCPEECGGGTALFAPPEGTSLAGRPPPLVGTPALPCPDPASLPRRTPSPLRAALRFRCSPPPQCAPSCPERHCAHHSLGPAGGTPLEAPRWRHPTQR